MDIYSSTVTGALCAVDTLLERGYKFVTVGELYRRRGVTLQDGVKYYSGKNNGIDLGPVKKPVITYESESGGIRVTIHSPRGAPIYYSFDGISYNLYTGPVAVNPGTTIRAYAGGENYILSDQIMRHYSENGNLFAAVYPGDWYYASIDKLAAAGILQGVGNDAFSQTKVLPVICWW